MSGALLAIFLSTAPAVEASADGGLGAKELLQRLDEMKGQLKGRPKTAEIEFALGNLYYDNGRWPDAIDSFRQLVERADGPLHHYLEQRGRVHRAGTLGQAHCDAKGATTFEAYLAAAEKFEHAGNQAAAIRCEESALLPVALALTRQGNAWYLIGNNERAALAHRRALELMPDDPDSLFFLGAILFESGDGDLAQLKQSQIYWNRYLQVAGDGEVDRVRLVKKDLPRLQAALDAGGKIPPAAEK